MYCSHNSMKVMKSIILVPTGSAKLCDEYQSVQTLVSLKCALLVVMVSCCFARVVERKTTYLALSAISKGAF